MSPAAIAIATFGTTFAYMIALVVIIVRQERKAAFKAQVDRIVARWSRVAVR